MQHSDNQAVIEVDGSNYKFNKWSASTSFKLLFRLGRWLGPPMAALFSTAQEQKNPQQKVDEAEALAAAMRDLFLMDPTSALGLCKELLGKVTLDGTDIAEQFDLIFQGRMGHLLKVLKEQLSFQYGDFFGAIASLNVKADPEPMAASKSRNT